MLHETAKRDLKAVIDGSEPFDAPEEGKDQPGNDSGENNRIVRTYDTVRYQLTLTAEKRSAFSTMENYVAVLEAELPMDITQAQFDTSRLTEVFYGDEDWSIEYKNSAGDNLYIENKSGIYKCDGSGAITGTKVTLNQIVKGSDNTNGNAYRTDVASQRLVAYRLVTPTEGSEASVPGTENVDVRINVTAAQNGDTIEPKFKAWVKGNKDNFTSEQNNNNDYVVSVASQDNVVDIKSSNEATKEYVVTVSAAARYNIVIKRNQDFQYSSYFDFETGKESSAEEGGTYGRMFGYGITLQLFNETNRLIEMKDDKGNVVKDNDGNPLYVSDGDVLEAKGMRGIELPVNGITFDLTLNGNKGNSISEDDYSAILWDYALSMENTKTGKWGRNMFWNNSTASAYPKGAGVYSSGNRKSSAYNSGTWSLVASSDTEADLDSEGKTTSSITDTGEHVKYTFTVTGFDFDFENFTFPYESAGNAGTANWLAPSYIGSFSAGHIQVLQKYPATATADASPEITAAVSNYQGTSKSGQPATTEARAVTDAIGGTRDNKVTSNTAIYTPGGISKHNSFGSRVDEKGNPRHGSISIGFLGTVYWAGPAYDADTFAGSSIYLWGGAQLSRNSDGVVSAYNLLQKFDSKALSIDKSVENPVRYTDVNNDSAWPAEGWPNNKEGKLLEAAGEYKILYAADPQYPEGWDSNDPEQMARMNNAKEDDLIYFTSLEDLESKEYTCIAVLLEVRNAAIPAGCYPGVRIAMKVSENETGDVIGKTVCMVNTAFMWIKRRDSEINLLEDISWENYVWNENSKKSVIRNSAGEDVYSKYWNGTGNTVSQVNQTLRDETGEGNVNYLVQQYNNFNYHKTEYNSGIKVENTHEGYQQGMSLLVIGYESEVGIKVQNTRKTDNSADSDTINSDNVSFDITNGDWSALYTIKGIKTTATDPSGTGMTDVNTGLTITATLPTDTKDNEDITIAASAFQVKSLEEEMDADGKPTGEMVWVEISERENDPTTMIFRDNEGQEREYKIWAERKGDNTAVFHLSDVPVGEALPDIRFTGQFSAQVTDGDSFTAQVTIQGDQDNRSLSSNNRNIASVAIGIVSLGGTSLTKTVDHNLIELDGEFTYGVNYTNNSDEVMRQRLFLYDLMPYNGDIRSTNFERIEVDENGNYVDAGETLQVLEIGARLSGAGAGEAKTIVRQYYSTIPGYVLKPYLEFSNGGESRKADDIENLLKNALIGNDANGLYYVVEEGKTEPVSIYAYDENNVVTGINPAFAGDYNTSDPYGEVTLPSGYQFYNVTGKYWVSSGGLVDNNTSTGSGGSIELHCYKLFRWLGSIQPGNGGGSLSSGNGTASSHLDNATCIYSVVESLGAHATLTISAHLKTKGNEATNLYGNIAHSWKEGDMRNGANLISNQVTTRVISRELSGLVWEDINHDGIRNQTVSGVDEPLIEGVTCTLFRWNGLSYEAVKGNGGPNERQIEVTYEKDGKTVTETIAEGAVVQLVTGADGAYSFSNLRDGSYVVAFSGESLKEYEDYDKKNPDRGATQYQVNKANDNTTNDGVANGTKNKDGKITGALPGIDGTDYPYYIKYSAESNTASGTNITMHTLNELRSNSALLSNNVEVLTHQDLGVYIERYEMPETGGRGTLPYRVAGILLMIACLPGNIFIWRRKQKRNKAKGKI